MNSYKAKDMQVAQLHMPVGWPLQFIDWRHYALN